MGKVIVKYKIRKIALAVVLSFLLLSVFISSGACRPGPYRLTVSGTSQEMGLQIGSEYLHIIKKLHSDLISLTMKISRKGKKEIYHKAGKLAKYISREDINEIKGVARGCGLNYEDILFLNVFYNLTAERLLCRQLSAWGSATKDGELLHARNLDWMDYPGKPLRRYNLILNYKPKIGIEYLICTWPGLVCVLTGTNRAGITIAFNRLAGKYRSKRYAEPIFFTMKRVLRFSKTLDDAIDLFRDKRPLGNGTILISSAGEKKAAVIEIKNGRIGVRIPEGDMIGNANHATRETGLGRGLAGRPACDTAKRFLPLDYINTRKVMGHRKVLLPTNILSVIFMPKKNRMYLACGRYLAALMRFEEYTLFPGGK